jgi:hypothetical protein
LEIADTGGVTGAKQGWSKSHCICVLVASCEIR